MSSIRAKIIFGSSLSLLIANLISCSGGMGSSASGGAPKQNAGNGSGGQQVDPSVVLTTQGVYTETQTLPSSFTGHLTTGCSTPGTYSPTSIIDPRLAMGMKYEISFRSLQPSTGLIYAAGQGTIVLTTSSTIVGTGTVTAVNNISGISVGYASTRTCILDSSGKTTCAFLPLPSLSFPAGSKISCIAQNETQTSFKISSGTFVTATGQSVPAYKILADVTGDIVCDGVKVDTGKIQYFYILSNNVPAEDTAHYCGGVLLFNGTSYYSSTGAHILTAAFEKLRVPVVP